MPHTAFSKRISAWIDRKYRFIQKNYYNEQFMYNIFAEIYKKNIWTGEESISGPGSSLSQTQKIRQQLPSLLRKLSVTSLLDIPCGDFYWMQYVDLSFLQQYIGADILPALIEHNKKSYIDKKRVFETLDVTKDPLPKVDLILLRDCLVHFSYKDVFKALENIKKSKSKFLLTTTFLKRDVNEDIITGYWRPLNFQKAPFYFPKPLFILNENCTEAEGRYKDKSLGLWKIQDIGEQKI